MNLDIIKLQTTWNDAAGSINSNYAKIADAIAQLKANGGGGGGISELTSKMVVDALGYTPYNSNNPANYITDSALTPYAKTADVSITYATIASVQGFENRIGGLEGAVPRLNERVTTVEGKVSSLNELVSTGDNNLLNRVNVIEQEYATKTYVDNAIGGIDLSAYLLKADLTKSRIQSTLGISDWALAATKPSYAWSEITSRPTALSQFTDDVVAGKFLRATIYGRFDADTIFNDGFQSGNILHLPSGSPYGIVHTLSYRGGSNNAKPGYATQIFIPCGDDSTSPNDMFFRTSLADAWNAWNKVITDRNIKDQYVAGVYDSYNPLMKITFKYAGGGVTSNPAWLACWNDYTLTYVSPDNVKAGSATKLATRCKLWGQSFDGTGDVTHGFRSLCPNSYNGGVAHSILNNSGDPYGLITRIYGNGNVSLQAQREDDNAECFDLLLNPLGGNVGIGTTSPTERLDVSGNIKASGNINATSITINGVTITASNGTITVNGNVFATGAITAKA